MLAFSVYYWVLGEFAFVPDRWQEKGICSGGGSWFMQWTTTALLEVLGVLIDSSPCQQHMSAPSDSFPRELGRIAPHHINILGYNPQWNVLPPNIPRIVPHHHREHRLGSFSIPCWSFWGLIPGLRFDRMTSRVSKCCVKRGSKEVHDCWRIVYGVRFRCQREGR